jgi:hypothetical protein
MKEGAKRLLSRGLYFFRTGVMGNTWTTSTWPGSVIAT